jgi:hypothetical protein
MNQAPIARVLSDRPLDEKTLLGRLQRELWPVAQAMLRLLNSVTVTAVRELTADATLDGTEDLVKVDATAGNVTLTLPAPETWMRQVTVIKTDATANTVTVTSVTTGDPILAAQWNTTTIMQDGTSFYEV